MIYWLLKLVVIGPALRYLFRPQVEGLHHVPDRGPAILASNHLSFSDSIFLPLALPRRITFPAKMEYFTGTGLKGRLIAQFFRSTGQIPIDRTGGDAARGALEAGLGILRQGELFGIYPEGTRSPDGRLYRGKTGVARLALESGAPIVPVAMIGTDRVQPTGQLIPSREKVAVRFGAPIDPRARRAELAATGADEQEIARAITDEVMRSLAQLSGQEYVDEYAATRKRALKERAEALVAQARVEAEHVAGRAQAAAGVAGDRAREAADRAREAADRAREAMERTREAADALVSDERVVRVRAVAVEQAERAGHLFRRDAESADHADSGASAGTETGTSTGIETAGERKRAAATVGVSGAATDGVPRVANETDDISDPDAAPVVQQGSTAAGAASAATAQVRPVSAEGAGAFPSADDGADLLPVRYRRP